MGHCPSTDVCDEGASAGQTSQQRTRRFGLRLASLCMAVMLLASGCAVIPMGESGPLADTEGENLAGQTGQQVHELLGEPGLTLEQPSTTYLLYGARGTKEGFLIIHPGFLIPAWLFNDGPVITESLTHCLLVELRDEKVVRTALESSSSLSTNVCPRVFSEDGSFMTFATAWVTSRELRGGVLSALETVWEFGDPEVLRTLAEQGDSEAALELARRYEEPSFMRILAEQGDTETAIELAKKYNDLGPLTLIAEQGGKEAALSLSRDFGELGPVRKLAERGDADAALELALVTGDLGPLRTIAEGGNAEAALGLFQNFEEAELLWALALSDGTETAEVAFKIYEQATYTGRPQREVVKWLCKAANKRHAQAQVNLARLHRPWNDEDGLQENKRVAYMWYTLAAVGGEDTLDSRGIVAEEMTVQQIAEAEEMARNWKPGQCPAP